MKEVFQQLFEYRNGELYWRQKPAKQISAGARAGTVCINGYRKIQCAYGVSLEHRVVWIMHNGNIPEGLCIDHIDHNQQNNKLQNLRLATITQNVWNSKKGKNNRSGYKGVYFCKEKNRWVSQITENGKTHHLGYFSSAELASEAYKRKAGNVHLQFANHS